MRPIDADYVKSKLNKSALGGHLHYYVCGVIDDAPTIDAESVKHGRWISKGFWIECSNCKKTLVRDNIEITAVFENGLPTYCPHCGAKMDGGADDEKV